MTEFAEITQEIKEEVEYVMSLLKLEIEKEFIDQGHGKKGRSKLIDTAEVKTQILASVIKSELFMERYFRFVNDGVKASRVPYQRGSGRKTSKYIEALILFFRRKGLGQKRSERAAFATATLAKRQGHPTRSSFRFSKNGRRTKFVDFTLERLEDKMLNLLSDKVEQSVILKFNKVLERTQRQIS